MVIPSQSPPRPCRESVSKVIAPPVINIAHLERYEKSPEEFEGRTTKHLQRLDFADLPEYDIDQIVAERKRKGRGGRRITEYRVRWTGYAPEFDEWLSSRQLRNAPKILDEWAKRSNPELPYVPRATDPDIANAPLATTPGNALSLHSAADARPLI